MLSTLHMLPFYPQRSSEGLLLGTLFWKYLLPNFYLIVFLGIYEFYILRILSFFHLCCKYYSFNLSFDFIDDLFFHTVCVYVYSSSLLFWSVLGRFLLPQIMKHANTELPS
jgi:uncharacterized membrane protein